MFKIKCTIVILFFLCIGCVKKEPIDLIFVEEWNQVTFDYLEKCYPNFNKSILKISLNKSFREKNRDKALEHVKIDKGSKKIEIFELYEENYFQISFFIDGNKLNEFSYDSENDSFQISDDVGDYNISIFQNEDLNCFDDSSHYPILSVYSKIYLVNKEVSKIKVITR